MKAKISAAQQGNASALEQLVIENSGLVYTVMKRFLNRGQSKEDLYQIGCIGLIKAIKQFDLSLGLQFSTYAVPLIIGELKQFFRNDNMIKVSRSWQSVAYKASYLREEQMKKTGKELSISELAVRIHISSEELILALDACQSPESLDVSPEINSLPGECFPLNELIDRIAVKEAIDQLNEEEQKIILLRYFRQKSQKDTGEILCLSQAHISRLEKKILKKLKEFL